MLLSAAGVDIIDEPGRQDDETDTQRNSSSTPILRPQEWFAVINEWQTFRVGLQLPCRDAPPRPEARLRTALVCR